MNVYASGVNAAQCVGKFMIRVGDGRSCGCEFLLSVADGHSNEQIV